MNKTVGPPSITPTGINSGMNLGGSGNQANIYATYYKAIEQFQNKSLTDKDIQDTLKQGPISTTQYYNNFLNEINNKNNNNQQQQQQHQQHQQHQQQMNSSNNFMNNNIRKK